MLYAIRLPANKVLQESIAHLLKRPVGRPPKDVRRYHASFSYQAGTWDKPRRVVAKFEWHPGELYPRVGFIVTNLGRPAERVVAFYNQRGTAEQWIKEGKNAIRWTRLSCRRFDHNAVRLQLHALESHHLPGYVFGKQLDGLVEFVMVDIVVVLTHKFLAVPLDCAFFVGCHQRSLFSVSLKNIPSAKKANLRRLGCRIHYLVLQLGYRGVVMKTLSTNGVGEILDALAEIRDLDASHARTMPAGFYASEAFLELEKEEIFRKEWVCLGRIDEVRKKGDYFTTQLLDEPLIVTRGHDDKVPCFPTSAAIVRR